jgi:hypothetical protein
MESNIGASRVLILDRLGVRVIRQRILSIYRIKCVLEGLGRISFILSAYSLVFFYYLDARFDDWRIHLVDAGME